jgi:hypothetical protein
MHPGPQKPRLEVFDPEQVTWEPVSSSNMVIKCQARQDVTTSFHACLGTGTRELESIQLLPDKVALLHSEHS